MTPTVLLVDDQPTNLLLLERLLEPLGYRTIRANDGAEALAIVELEPVDLVLLDLHMPGMDGIEVLMRLRARPTWVPIVLVTAANRSEEWLRGASAGADDFIEKPVVRELLLARVRTLLGLKASREQLSQRNAALEQLLHRQQELLDLVANDLHSPLLVVQANLHYARQLMTRAEDDGGDPAAALEDVIASSTRLVGLAESLVAITLLERDEYPLRRSRLDLKTLVDEVVPTFRRQAARRKITLTTDAPAGVLLEADARLLKRAVESLVDLAVREAPPDAIIAIEARAGREITLRLGRTRPATPPASDDDRFVEAPRNAGEVPAAQFCRRVMAAHGGVLTLDATPEFAVRFVLHFPLPTAVAA